MERPTPVKEKTTQHLIQDPLQEARIAQDVYVP
jgi:hypothetical protein